MNTKPFWRSGTLLGVLALVVAVFFGQDIDNLTGLWFSSEILGGIGFVVAVIRRTVADRKIKWPLLGD